MIGNFLFSFIIKPIELILEFIFASAYKITGNLGISVICVGIIMNILILPIYVKADKISKMQAEKEKQMKPFIARINKAFKGDERFMMLQAYYRENNHSPLHILLSSMSLLLEIPFFVAGFHLLSGLKIVEGVPFLFVKDLSLPDNLFSIGSLPVNILPILMTLINLVSSVIYSKNQTTKGKVQTYALALVFLVLLYNSPSCLVIYWTTNNLFSLLKNIVMETPVGKSLKKIKITLPKISIFEEKAGKADHVLTFMSLLFIAVLTGFQVTSDVVASAIESFIYPRELLNPLYYAFNSLFIGLGIYVLWGGLIYYMLPNGGKKFMGFFTGAMSLICLIDYFGFGEQGTLQPSLQFESGIKAHPADKIMINCLVIVLIFLLVYIFYKNSRKILSFVVLVELMSVLLLGGINTVKINSQFNECLYLKDQTQTAEFELSRDGRNVIVIMIDKFSGYLMPYLLKEDPSLMEQFDGFTYYPDTLSFGNYTIIGSPALFGGYDYTPQILDNDPDQELRVAQNNALRVMPLNFLDAGFDVTVADPAYADFKWYPDLSIYSDHPEIDAYVTTSYMNYMVDGNANKVVWERNLFCFGFFRLSPLICRNLLYDNSMYNAADREHFNDYTQIASDGHNARGYFPDFLDTYTALTQLSDITTVNGSGDNFLMFANYTAHDVCLLSEPSYEPALYVDNTEYDNAHMDRFVLDDGSTLVMENALQYGYYECCMCSLRNLGVWFDYLRENGCWDNTRIVLVADHGFNMHMDDPVLFDGADAEHYNPLLMVKDFGSTGFTVSDEFMTNADTLFLAMDGIIDNPVDPSTGAPLTDSMKYDRPLVVFDYPNYLLYDNYGAYTYTDGYWYNVYGDVFDADGWEYIGIS